MRSDEIRSLLDAPSPASLTLYREDGDAVVSPVWFREADDLFEVVMAASDHKLALLRRDPRCVLLIFEATSPFRGVAAVGRPAREELDSGVSATRSPWQHGCVNQATLRQAIQAQGMAA